MEPLIEQLECYLDLTPKVSIFSVKHILERLESIINNHYSEYSANLNIVPYGFFSPLTNQKIIHENQNYVVEHNGLVEEKVYTGTEEDFRYFISSNVYNPEDNKIIHRKNDFQNVSFIGGASSKSTDIVLFLLNDICKKKLPKEYNSKENTQTILNLLREHFQDVMEKYSSEKELDNIGLPKGLVKNKLVQSLCSISGDLNDVMLAQENYDHRNLYTAVHYKKHVILINMGDRRTVEWELAKAYHLFTTQLTNLEKGLVDIIQFSMIDKPMSILPKYLVEEYIEYIEKETLIKHKNNLIFL